MPLSPERVRIEEAPDMLRACPPRCPVCSGPLLELRTNLRCSRCYFSICEGCAGEQPEACFGMGD